MIIRFAYSLALLLSFSGVDAARASDRMAILAESNLLEKISEDLGECETESTDYAIELRCDGAKVVVRIDVVTPYDPGPFSSASRRYLADRRSYCAQVVSNWSGRCIGTDRIRPRFGLRGFRSRSKESAKLYRHEIVAFFRSEMLRAVVLAERQSIGHDLDGLLQSALARLTPLW